MELIDVQWLKPLTAETNKLVEKDLNWNAVTERLTKGDKGKRENKSSEKVTVANEVFKICMKNNNTTKSLFLNPNNPKNRVNMKRN